MVTILILGKSHPEIRLSTKRMVVLILQRAMRHPPHTHTHPKEIECRCSETAKIEVPTCGCCLWPRPGPWERESPGTPCPQRGQLRPTVLTHTLSRESPLSADVLSLRKWKLIEVFWVNFVLPLTRLAGFPPVLLEITGSTFANKKIVSIQFLVDLGSCGDWPGSSGLSSVFLPGSSFWFQFHQHPFSFHFFLSGLIAHWFIVNFLRSVNSNRYDRQGARGKQVDRHTLWSSPPGLAGSLLST